MAAEEAWKTQFRELVTQAELLCIGRWKIPYARGFLEDPMPAAAAVGTADAVRDILQHPEQTLENAAGDVAEVLNLLGSARELARRGGTGDAPAQPLPSILGILGMTHVQRQAWRRARDAKMLAVEAYHAMELCCDCLLMIRIMVLRPQNLLPDVDDVIEGQRSEGYQHLVTAKEKFDACAAQIALALQDVAGAAD